MEFVRSLVVEQRARLVGAIMGFAEKEMYPHLPIEVRAAFRSKVMAAVGQYHDFVLDCLKASVVTDGVVINQEALALIERIHTDVRWLASEEEVK